MTDETLAASLMKQAAARAAREQVQRIAGPKQIAWENPNRVNTVGGFFLPSGSSAPTFTTSNTTSANYYNAAATASGAR